MTKSGLGDRAVQGDREGIAKALPSVVRYMAGFEPGYVAEQGAARFLAVFRVRQPDAEARHAQEEVPVLVDERFAGKLGE